MLDDTLFRRVEKAVPCDVHKTDRFGDCFGGPYSGYDAGAQELRRTQRVWRAYLAAYRSAGRQVLPRLSQTAVGCYSLALRPNHRGPVVIDRTRLIAVELDTLPLPGTVRPSTLRLLEHITIAGSAKWSAHYESRLLVSWGDLKTGPYLGINFGGSDSALASYQFYPSSADTLASIGNVEVTRVACSAGSSRM